MGGSTMDNYYKGISFPFRFNAHGRVEKSKLTPNDYTRILESIQQIIFTYQMERIMNIQFGMDRGAVFTNTGDITDISIMKHNIEKAIITFEPRVEINALEIYPDPEKEGTLLVVLDLHIIKFLKDVTLTVPVDTGTSEV